MGRYFSGQTRELMTEYTVSLREVPPTARERTYLMMIMRSELECSLQQVLKLVNGPLPVVLLHTEWKERAEGLVKALYGAGAIMHVSEREYSGDPIEQNMPWDGPCPQGTPDLSQPGPEPTTDHESIVRSMARVFEQVLPKARVKVEQYADEGRWLLDVQYVRRRTDDQHEVWDNMVVEYQQGQGFTTVGFPR